MKRHQIYRYLTGECTEDEARDVEKHIESDPEVHQLFHEIKKVWEVTPTEDYEGDVDKAWNEIDAKISKSEDRNPTTKINSIHQSIYSRVIKSGSSMWLRVAAVLALVLISTTYLIFKTDVEMTAEVENEREMETVQTERAQQTRVRFGNGSVITLNSESSIQYPSTLENGKRKIYLDGEAYFEFNAASENQERFLVETESASVEVKGTEFNIRERPETNKAEIAVTEGKVMVSSNMEQSDKDQNNVQLTKGQMTVVDAGQAPTPPEEIDRSKILAWMRGEYIYDSTEFSSVLSEWERQFDVEFEVRDSTYLSIPFTGEFRSGESLNEMVRLTSQTLEFDYKRKENVFIISD